VTYDTPDGRFVLYTDHAAALDALENRADVAEERCRELRTQHDRAEARVKELEKAMRLWVEWKQVKMPAGAMGTRESMDRFEKFRDYMNALAAKEKPAPVPADAPKCEECGGSGHEYRQGCFGASIDWSRPCPACKGTGLAAKEKPTRPASGKGKPCPFCADMGMVQNRPCPLHDSGTGCKGGV